MPDDSARIVTIAYDPAKVGIIAKHYRLFLFAIGILAVVSVLEGLALYRTATRGGIAGAVPYFDACPYCNTPIWPCGWRAVPDGTNLRFEIVYACTRSHLLIAGAASPPIPAKPQTPPPQAVPAVPPPIGLK